ncbi:FAD-dependent oxidoreductase [Cetobacterium sp. 8H]|uniref:NAD(P)/FAD-dependent oxidoreductase n=1 Tax=Cetobacterium sp. 8H TaxID=2759681 RepID=UPI00163BFC48|nr:FAD-dependent oxidoreductase [Cetobacterium sp. 8H]MBC2851884.1 FAD-dependent oxidoreductase [Cetobacterium sp. 8H]
MEKTLLLVGGGHAHVYLINKIIKEKQKFKTILVSSSQYQFYSGMASGYIENIYSDTDINFDLKRLCKLGEIEFFEEKVVKIDPKNKNVTLKSGEKIEFDIASFDTGSELKIDNKYLDKEKIIGIKPLTNLKKIKEKLRNLNFEKIKILVIGAGAAGIELSLALKELEKQLNKKIEINILDRGDTLLSTFPKKVQDIVKEKIYQSSIVLHLNEEVEEIKDKQLITKKGLILDYDLILWAGGPTSNQIYKNSGMSVDSKGYMIVNHFLQNVDFEYIFGAGDCISIQNYSHIKKVGVYAIKEAPYLWKNILNYFNAKSLEAYIPQNEFLLIISLGNKKGVLSYKDIVLNGSLVWKLKNYIDKGFMKKFNTEF